MIEAFIFDFDGVIVDMEKYHYMAWNSALENIKCQLTEDEYEPLKSTGKMNILQYVLKKENIDFNDEVAAYLFHQKDLFFKQYIEKISRDDFVLGIEDFLVLLKNKGYRLAVASSSSQTKELLKRFNIEKYFECVIDGNFNCPKKPSPDIFCETLSRLSVSADRAIVFEDSIAGLKAASAAKIAAIYIGNISNELAIMRMKNFKNADSDFLIQVENYVKERV